MKLMRIGKTFGLLNFRKKRMYLLQFSLKDVWLVPKCDKHYGENKNIVLYGWLFVYFGYSDYSEV